MLFNPLKLTLRGRKGAEIFKRRENIEILQKVEKVQQIMIICFPQICKFFL